MIAYADWKESIADDLDFIKTELKEAMSPTPEDMKVSAVTAEGWYGRMLELLAEANKYLDLAENNKRVPKMPGLTDYDREIILAGAVSDERETRDKIEGYSEAIRTRISLVQSLLGYEKSTHVYGNKEGQE